MAESSIRSGGMSVVGDVFEIGALSSPVWIGSAVLVVSGTLESPALLWSGLGLLSLAIAIGFSRHSPIEHTLITWPVPETPADWATSVIAYNATLFLGTVLATGAWFAIDSWAVGSVVAVVAPVWFLHHVYFFIYKIGKDEKP